VEPTKRARAAASSESRNATRPRGDATSEPSAYALQARRKSSLVQQRKGPVSILDELFAVCGGLLGSIEVIGCELSEDSDPQLLRSVEDARELGAKLRERVEALVTLTLPVLGEALQLSDFSFGRWLEHASRGSLLQLKSLEIALESQYDPALKQVQVEIDVSRMDRALTTMCESVARAAGPHGRLILRAQVEGAHAHVDILGAASGGLGDAFSEPVPELFLRAWQALLAAHGGSFSFEPSTLHLHLVVPLAKAR
jgi:hypothetical protein